jgi:hypothetical protein
VSLTVSDRNAPLVTGSSPKEHVPLQLPLGIVLQWLLVLAVPHIVSVIYVAIIIVLRACPVNVGPWPCYHLEVDEGSTQGSCDTEGVVQRGPRRRAQYDNHQTL